MLILTRRVGETLVINGNIIVKVMAVGPNSTKLGVDCPREMPIVRSELLTVEKEPNEKPASVSQPCGQYPHHD